MRKAIRGAGMGRVPRQTERNANIFACASDSAPQLSEVESLSSSYWLR